MSKLMSKEQVEDLLINVLHSPKITHWKGSKIQFCCTVHGEKHPSAGVNIDFQRTDKDGNLSSVHEQVFNCFSCGANGSIPRLVYESLPDEFGSIYEAKMFLEDRYDIEFTFNFETEEFECARYEDQFNTVEKVKKRLELPLYKIAPYKSGKETFKYFFDRGFTKETMRKFMIGRDLVNETITMPIFWEDDRLAGIIGRYIDPRRPHNMRFMIYEFPKGQIVFPLNHFQAIDNTTVLIEAQMDAMIMNQWGMTNALSTMGMMPTKEQLRLIADRCDKLIYLYNPDKAGQEALPYVKEYMRDRKVQVLTVDYPDPEIYGKDPSEWGEELTREVLATAKVTKKKLQRL